jgi:muramoyltetrapeptide carboxypeptidase LdcA involved in peptidoglycan recycling
MKGRLLGGCLDCLDILVGTRFDKVEEFCEKYREDGILWFMESCDLNPMGIRRALWQLKEAGWFRYVKGFLIGRPLCFGEEMMGLDAYHAVFDILQEYHVPIIMDVDLGHLPPSMPIMCGAVGVVEVEDIGERLEISITYEME